MRNRFVTDVRCLIMMTRDPGGRLAAHRKDVWDTIVVVKKQRCGGHGRWQTCTLRRRAGARKGIPCANRDAAVAERDAPVAKAENAGPPPSHPPPPPPPSRLALRSCLSSHFIFPSAGSSRHHSLAPLNVAHDWRRVTVRCRVSPRGCESPRPLHSKRAPWSTPPTPTVRKVLIAMLPGCCEV